MSGFGSTFRTQREDPSQSGSRPADVKGTQSDVLTSCPFVHFHNLQLQKSPSRIFGQNSGNSVEISKAFFEMGIWKFESSQVSQAVTQLEIVGLRIG
jgi:hypothetical protein